MNVKMQPTTSQQPRQELLPCKAEHTAILSTALPNPEVSSDSGIHIFDLPQEILYMICDHAYPTVQGFKTISRSRWEFNEKLGRKRCGKKYIKHPFPSTKASQFLVCKQFFLAAAKAFIGNQKVNNLEQYCDDDDDSLRHLNIIMRFVRTAKTDLGSIQSLFGSHSSLPSLKKFTIAVRDHHFDVLEPRYPWEEEYSEHSFEPVMKEHCLERLADIREFQFSFHPGYHAKTKGLDMWRHNMSRFEKYVRAYVTQVKGRLVESKMENTANLFRASKTSEKDSEVAEGENKTYVGSTEESATPMKFNQLPETAEEMITLLKTNGEEVMSLIARLKAQERGKQNGHLISE